MEADYEKIHAEDLVVALFVLFRRRWTVHRS